MPVCGEEVSNLEDTGNPSGHVCARYSCSQSEETAGARSFDSLETSLQRPSPAPLQRPKAQAQAPSSQAGP